MIVRLICLVRICMTNDAKMILTSYLSGFALSWFVASYTFRGDLGGSCICSLNYPDGGRWGREEGEGREGVKLLKLAWLVQ